MRKREPAMRLKAIFQSQLDHAFGLSESEIAGRSDLSSERIVRGRHHWIIELRMIERVEEFRPELYLVPLGDV